MSDGRDDNYDPMAVIRLMWLEREPQSRGPKARLSLDAIVDAAVRLADAGGIDGLSMRKVAAELGAGAMSLYTYVGSKGELVELMVDRVFGEITAPDPALHWREQVRRLAVQSWEFYHRHPWILQTNLWRLSLGPNVLAATEAMYAALEAGGMPPDSIVTASSLIGAYVQGAARNSVTEARTVAETGESVEDYFGRRGDFWEKYFDSTRFPMHVRIWEAGGFDKATDDFQDGLDMLLAGVELTTRRSP